MSKKSKVAYEHYLNQLFKAMYNIQEALNELDYLCSPLRGSEMASKKVVKRNIIAWKVGYIIRKYDPIRFEVGYGEWIRE